MGIELRMNRNTAKSYGKPLEGGGGTVYPDSICALRNACANGVSASRAEQSRAEQSRAEQSRAEITQSSSFNNTLPPSGAIRPIGPIRPIGFFTLISPDFELKRT